MPCYIQGYERRSKAQSKWLVLRGALHELKGEETEGLTRKFQLRALEIDHKWCSN